jgi:hypothetical protein
MREHKTQFEIKIVTNDKKITHTFVKEYSMDEHYNLLYIGEGRKYADRKHGCREVIVQCNYLPDIIIKKSLMKLLGLTNGEQLSSKVHNPLQSDFNQYQRCIINNTEVLIKSSSFGHYYATINKEWEYEFHQLPQANSIAA